MSGLRRLILPLSAITIVGAMGGQVGKAAA